MKRVTAMNGEENNMTSASTGDAQDLLPGTHPSLYLVLSLTPDRKMDVKVVLDS